jgi:hypothetical protein
MRENLPVLPLNSSNTAKFILRIGKRILRNVNYPRACECWQERKVRERREAKREEEEEAGVIQKSIKKDKRRRRIESVSQEGDPY